MDGLTTYQNCMCQECMDKEKLKKMWDNNGIIEGTQLSKIMDMKPSSANTSGVRGVYYEKKTGHWRAMIIFKRKRYSLGTYVNFEDAVKARKKGEEEFFGTFLEGLKSRGEI